MDDLPFFEEHNDDETICYGGIVVKPAKKQGKALTLLADAVFNPALVIIEQIQTGLIQVQGKSVIELGAGTGMPGLYAAAHGARKVVLTDFPHPDILDPMQANVMANRSQLLCDCSVAGHEWGTPTTDLGVGFDMVILSDVLWYVDAHDALLSSLCNLLHVQHGIAWIGCGTYTPATCVSDFMTKASHVGLDSTRIHLYPTWQGHGGDDTETLELKKSKVQLWRMTWKAGG